MGKFSDKFTDSEERLLLSLFVTTPYADVFGVYETLLAPEQFATLGAAYSRTHEAFQSRLVRALADGDLLEPELLRSILRLHEEHYSIQEELKQVKLSDVVRAHIQAPDFIETLSHFKGVPKKAGAFIQKWAQEYGHNSIKEMGMLRFCAENIPDYTGKHITGHPLAHPQVKSSRYIDWAGLHDLMEHNLDIQNSRFSAEMGECLKKLSTTYDSLSDRLAKFVEGAPVNLSWLSEQQREENLLAALAAKRLEPLPELLEKERAARVEALRRDARRSIFDTTRYLLTPAMPTSVACAVDARSAEDILTSLLSSPLLEDQKLGEELWRELRKVQPVLLGDKCHAGKNEYLIEQRVKGEELSRKLFSFELERQYERTARTNFLPEVESFSEAQLAASLVYPYGHGSFMQYYSELKRSPEKTREIISTMLAGRGKYDPFPAELAQGGEMREFLMDYGGYRDVFRHRRGARSRQLISTWHGFEVPALIDVASVRQEYDSIHAEVDTLFRKVVESEPYAAQLIIPFSYRCRSLYSWSLQQDLYFVELRGKPTANESYRTIAFDIAEHWQKKAPAVAKHLRLDKRSYPPELTLLARKWYDGRN